MSTFRSQGRAGEPVGIGGHHVVVRRAQFEHVGDLLLVQSGRIVDVAVGARDRHDLRAQFGRLGRHAPRHVAEARDGDHLPFDLHTGRFEHLAQEIDGAEARRLGTDERTAVGHPLAREHARILARQLAVHAVEVADLAAAHADVTGRNVGLGADVAPQFDHEGLAEAHHFGVGLALGVEVRTALRTTHRERRQRVLEDLLEAEEFQDRGVDRRVEPQPALVGADGVVELEAVTGVDLHATPVVDPHHLEGETAVGFDDPLGDLVRLEFGMPVVGLLDGRQYLADGLQILAFTRVPALEFSHKFVHIHSIIVI